VRPTDAIDTVATTPDQVKQCCAAVYASDWVQLLLGDSFHPGGLALTERLGTLLKLGPEDHVLDVACGRGASAIHLARTFGCRVTGVDYSPENIERGREAARDSGLGDQVVFLHGDAEHLDLPSAAFDALICECALCTFPDKQSAVSEFRRVLRPGGRAGVSDVTRDGPLPPELDTLLARVACIADALPVQDYAALLEEADIGQASVEPHDMVVQEIVQRIRAGLLGAQILAGLGHLPPAMAGVDLRQAIELANLVAAAAHDGRLGYALITACDNDAV